MILDTYYIILRIILYYVLSYPAGCRRVTNWVVGGLAALAAAVVATAPPMALLPRAGPRTAATADSSGGWR